jgi:hypothetical protein
VHGLRPDLGGDLVQHAEQHRGIRPVPDVLELPEAAQTRSQLNLTWISRIAAAIMLVLAGLSLAEALS